MKNEYFLHMSFFIIFIKKRYIWLLLANLKKRIKIFINHERSLSLLTKGFFSTKYNKLMRIKVALQKPLIFGT